jgi:hypothetical protein
MLGYNFLFILIEQYDSDKLTSLFCCGYITAPKSFVLLAQQYEEKDSEKVLSDDMNI